MVGSKIKRPISMGEEKRMVGEVKAVGHMERGEKGQGKDMESIRV